MRIQHNIMAMNSYRNYTNNVSAMKKNLEKLSSGYKINRAGDDAAGLAISEKMRAQITGLKQAQNNAKSGINLVQTAEGALTEVHDMLNRMLKLADQSANGTYDNTTDRNQLQKEVSQLKDEIDRIADSSNFNGINLLDGSLGDRATSGTATVNGVKRIEVLGGGNGTPKTAAKFTASAGTDGTITLKSAKVTGLSWQAVGLKNGPGGEVASGTDNTDGSVGVDDNKNGGSVTYVAVIDRTADGALAADLDYYEGMQVTVTVDAANAEGNYGTTAVAATVGDAKGLTLQIGDTSDKFNQLNVTIGDMHVNKLNIDTVDISTQTGAQEAVKKLKDAINKVSDVRGTLGATQNRLDHTINNLSVMEENIQDAESTIRDTDVADEMMAYTKNNILIQSAQAMLAQANQVPQGVLQLLQ